MAGNKVDVIVNFKAMTNDVVHKLDMVKKKLNSMNLTNGAGDKLSQSIEQAYRKAEKFIDVLGKPIKDKADISNISKSYEGLLGSVRTVENEIYKLFDEVFLYNVYFAEPDIYDRKILNNTIVYRWN